MAYEIPNFFVGVFPANIDMSNEATFQFCGVGIGAATGSVQGTGTGGAALIAVTAQGQNILGILQNNPLQGDAGNVMEHGVSKAQAGAAVATIGTLLMVNASGQFIPVTAGNNAVAMALESAASGDVFTVLVKPFGKQ